MPHRDRKKFTTKLRIQLENDILFREMDQNHTSEVQVDFITKQNTSRTPMDNSPSKWKPDADRTVELPVDFNTHFGAIKPKKNNINM